MSMWVSAVFKKPYAGLELSGHSGWNWGRSARVHATLIVSSKTNQMGNYLPYPKF